MFGPFGLTLMVTHACNLRCTYCYTGQKTARRMPLPIGRRAIDRAAASLKPGGTLELGFFGGEPLLEAESILHWLEHAAKTVVGDGRKLAPHLTTNGTRADGPAWDVLLRPEMNVVVSCDGLPAVHDRHRRTADGGESSAEVLITMDKLAAAGKAFSVAMVVRADTLAQLPAGIEFLRGRGVEQLVLGLDLWHPWSNADLAALLKLLAALAELWRRGLPEGGLNWFDYRAAALSGVTLAPSARCGFGAGEIAVAPSGHFYPCERLIGDDRDDNPMRLPGHVGDGTDFLDVKPCAARHAPQCLECGIAGACDTYCRCSNFVRTGNPGWPDGLLCHWNQECLRQTARMMEPSGPLNVSISREASA